jgi:hypothetical protein
MLFVKKKSPGSAARTGADRGEPEVLPPTDRGSRHAPGRGLFVRTARDVADVTDVADVADVADVTDARDELARAASPASSPSMRSTSAAHSAEAPEAYEVPETPEPVDPVAPTDPAARPGVVGRRTVPLAGLLSRWRARARDRRASVGTSDADTARVPRTRRARAEAPPASVLLVTELEGGRRVFWEVDATTLAPAAGEAARPAVSFSPEDRRFAVPQPLRSRAAQDLALMEIGEPVRVVNASRRERAVYATRAARVAETPGPLIPGPLALDTLLLRTGRERRNLVTGFVLKGVDGRTLALLYHADAQGELGALQVTANPENMEFTLAQFVASRRIDVDSHEVVLFDNADLLAVAGSLQRYPNETVIAGLALSQLLRLGAGLALVGACAGAAWAVTEYARDTDLQARQRSLNSDIRQATARNGELLQSALPGFARTLGLDTDVELARAQSLWLPGTRLSMEARATETRYRLVMPVVRGERVGARPSVASRLTAEELAGLVDFAPPEGCTREGLAVKGALNELQVSIVCQNPDSAFARYRLD